MNRQPPDGPLMDRASFARTLEEIATARMPFGKYGPAAFPPDGLPLDELPPEYLQWFLTKGGGFPRGRLGELMAFVHEAKAAGMDAVFEAGRAARGGRRPRTSRRREFDFDS
jgi:uncharacterized protein